MVDADAGDAEWLAHECHRFMVSLTPWGERPVTPRRNPSSRPHIIRLRGSAGFWRHERLSFLIPAYRPPPHAPTMRRLVLILPTLAFLFSAPLRAADRLIVFPPALKLEGPN